MTHRRAVLLMVTVTLLWSIAGVVARHLEAARSFEVTFWRSFFNMLALAIALTAMRGTAMWGQLLRAPWLFWVSSVCWAVMYTAFMVGLTLTSVANVLVVMAFGPLLTALSARLFLHHRLPPRTWGAIVTGSLGIAWMFGHDVDAGAPLLGSFVALAVPIAAACNWTVLQYVTHAKGDPDDATPASVPDPSPAPAIDMLPAVMVGAVLSAAVTLPLAWPLQASTHDLGLLALLGVVQLAIPCLLVVKASRVLPAPEIALLGLLEVVFGVLWAWLGAGEVPSSGALVGGGLVLAALLANEVLALRGARALSRTSASRVGL
ncbi:DMT family transporter [Uliginosibacterium sp. H1]|uniref:DMT family transporter n=1 Tax=Uliginosibacterium sp. H1 TaxID=3114757 RepID=UPI002E18CDF1|nr:DMT family transporter [Uliginosibacterium sp. H1]